MSISQKQMISLTKTMVKEFINEVQKMKGSFQSPVDYSEFVWTKKNEYLSQFNGIKRLIVKGTKLYLIVTDAESSLINQAALASSQFNNDYFAHLQLQGTPGTSKSFNAKKMELALLIEKQEYFEEDFQIAEPKMIPFESINFNPEQNNDFDNESFEFDVQIAETIINCNDSNCAIKTSCPDCSTSLIGGY